MPKLETGLWVLTKEVKNSTETDQNDKTARNDDLALELIKLGRRKILEDLVEISKMSYYKRIP